MQESINNCDVVVVGSGIFGSVIAEQCSRDGLKVVVIELRNHIGGNCYTEDDANTGINIHRYGPHIFIQVTKECGNISISSLSLTVIGTSV